MKVMIISTNADEAGAPRHCEALINELKNKVDFSFVHGEAGPVSERLLQAGIKCFCIQNFKSEISPIKDILSFFHILRLVILIKPDVLHLHSAKAGMIGRLVGCISKTPVIYTVHGFSWRGMSFFKRNLLKTIEYMLARLSNIYYVLVSEQMIFDAVNKLHIPHDNITVIHNGVPDVEGICSVQTSARKFCKVIMPARVCNAKDHDTLLRAFSNLSPKFRLILCGAGTDNSNFISRAKEITRDQFQYISFLGQRSDIQDLLAESDIFVLSSYFEALPISIIEALRAGIPVVASNVGGVSELIDQSCGFMFSQGDDSELAYYLTILDNSDLRNALGVCGRLRYQKYFSSARMAHLVYKYYLCKTRV